MRKKQQYDEYQLIKRYKIGYQTLFIVVFLTLINTYVKELYPDWASPSMEAIVLLTIPYIYFMVMVILKNAFFGKKEKGLPILILTITFSFIIMATYGPSVIDGTFTIIENGQLSDQSYPLFSLILFGTPAIAILIRKLIDKYEQKKHD